MPLTPVKYKSSFTPGYSESSLHQHLPALNPRLGKYTERFVFVNEHQNMNFSSNVAREVHGSMSSPTIDMPLPPISELGPAGETTPSSVSGIESRNSSRESVHSPRPIDATTTERKPKTSRLLFSIPKIIIECDDNKLLCAATSPTPKSPTNTIPNTNTNTINTSSPNTRVRPNHEWWKNRNFSQKLEDSQSPGHSSLPPKETDAVVPDFSNLRIMAIKSRHRPTPKTPATYYNHGCLQTDDIHAVIGGNQGRGVQEDKLASTRRPYQNHLVEFRKTQSKSPYENGRHDRGKRCPDTNQLGSSLQDQGDIYDFHEITKAFKDSPPNYSFNVTSGNPTSALRNYMSRQSSPSDQGCFSKIRQKNNQRALNTPNMHLFDVMATKQFNNNMNPSGDPIPKADVLDLSELIPGLNKEKELSSTERQKSSTSPSADLDKTHSGIPRPKSGGLNLIEMQNCDKQLIGERDLVGNKDVDGMELASVEEEEEMWNGFSCGHTSTGKVLEPTRDQSGGRGDEMISLQGNQSCHADVRSRDAKYDNSTGNSGKKDGDGRKTQDTIYNQSNDKNIMSGSTKYDGGRNKNDIVNISGKKTDSKAKSHSNYNQGAILDNVHDKKKTLFTKVNGDVADERSVSGNAKLSVGESGLYHRGALKAYNIEGHNTANNGGEGDDDDEDDDDDDDDDGTSENVKTYRLRNRKITSQKKTSNKGSFRHSENGVVGDLTLQEEEGKESRSFLTPDSKPVIPPSKNAILSAKRLTVEYEIPPTFRVSLEEGEEDEEEEEEDKLLKRIKSRVLRMRRRLPPPEPTKLCIVSKSGSMTHQEVKDEIERNSKVKVTSLQYDPVYIEQCREDNYKCMWIFEISEDSDRKRLLSNNIRVNKELVPVRPVDDVYSEEYRTFQMYYAVRMEQRQKKLVQRRKRR